MHAVEQSFNASVQSCFATISAESLTCMLYCGGCGICADDTNMTCIGRKHFVASDVAPCPINGE